MNATQTWQQCTHVSLRCSYHSHVNIESMSVGVLSHEAYISLAILDVGACRKEAAWLPSLVESIGAGIMYDACKQCTFTWGSGKPNAIELP